MQERGGGPGDGPGGGPGDELPSVLIIGGFATVPPNYWPLARRLRRRAVTRVDIAPIWPPDWAIAGTLGFGTLLRQAGRAIRRTYIAGGRRPIIVVGHSAGGIAARLAMSNVPYHGRIAGVNNQVGCLVTMGTPHGLSHVANRYHHAGHEAVEFLDRVTPGAHFAPRTAYLSLGSAYPAAPFRGVLGWLADEVFSVLVDSRRPIIGDGIVPLSAVHLDGARQVTFDDVRHGMIGAPWYGDDAILDRWWPTALALWQGALGARSGGPA